MTIRKVWKTNDNYVVDDLLQFCGGSHILATLLKNRGIDTEKKIINFLNPLKAKLSSPNVFLDMYKAVERIKSTIDKKENITVYGDFDADGVTSTALLYLTLKEIGASVDYYLPDRAVESHGLNTKALVKIISKRKSKLIITVDCGISNVSEINFAKGFKTDIIITDHHEAPENLPSAFAILNPKVPNSLDSTLDIEEIKSLNYLAGVGVAFKLACALLQEYSKENFVNDILPLAAVGTIGDVVELLGENRSIVSMGLELIKAGKHKGIQKLLASLSNIDLSNVTSETIAFGIVPKLNAAGRLESPETAIKMLILSDDSELDSTLSTLNDLNSLRQKLCDEAFYNAVNMYEKEMYSHKKSIVLLNDDWHVGIIGIVASKLVETFNKPVFLMTRDANSPNIIRCSCRSIDGINIHSILSEHKDIFEGFGGHKMAAGFSFDESKISFLEFKNRLNKTIDETTQNIDFNQVTVFADMKIEPSDISIDTIKIIEKLQPFGAANPLPLFVLNNSKLINYKMMGQNNNHLKMYVSKNNSSVFDCVKWNYPDFSLPINSELDLLFSLKINSFNGNDTIQLMIDDIHSPLLKYKENIIDVKFLDHRNKKNILPQVIDFVLSTKKKTAIYIENPNLLNQLELPEELRKLVFSSALIPTDIEQVMFFDIPISKEIFKIIIKNTSASIVHLMNFSSAIFTVDVFVAKLSGMLRYAVSNFDGIVNLERISKALSVPVETIECAFTLFDEAGMIEFEKIDDDNCKIFSINPVGVSKIKDSEIYSELEYNLLEIIEFRKFYLNTDINCVKEEVLC